MAHDGGGLEEVCAVKSSRDCTRPSTVSTSPRLLIQIELVFIMSGAENPQQQRQLRRESRQAARPLSVFFVCGCVSCPALDISFFSLEIYPWPLSRKHLRSLSGANYSSRRHHFPNISVIVRCLSVRFQPIDSHF